MCKAGIKTIYSPFLNAFQFPCCYTLMSYKTSSFRKQCSQQGQKSSPNNGPSLLRRKGFVCAELCNKIIKLSLLGKDWFMWATWRTPAKKRVLLSLKEIKIPPKAYILKYVRASKTRRAKFLREKSFPVCPALKNLLTTKCANNQKQGQNSIYVLWLRVIFYFQQTITQNQRGGRIICIGISLSPPAKAWNTARRAQEKLTSAQGESLSFYNSRL